MSDIKKLLEDFSRIESSTTRNSENLNEFGFLSKLQKSLEKRSPYQPTQQQDTKSWQPNQQQLAWLNKGGATNVDQFDPAIIARMPSNLGDKPPLQYYKPEDQKYAQQTAFIPQAIKDLTTPVDLKTPLKPEERAEADKALQRVLKSQQQQQLPSGMEPSLEESGLQTYLGNKKYGKDGMDSLRKAGREGASKEKRAKIRAKYDKLDEEGVAEGSESTISKCASLATKYFNSADLQQQYDIDEYIKNNAGATSIVNKCASLAAKYFNSAGLQRQYDIGEYIKANAKKGVVEGREAQKTFKVVYHSPKTDRNVTKMIKASNESEIWDKLQLKGIQVISVTEQGVAEMDNRTPSGDRREQRADSPEEKARRKKELQANLKKVSPEMRKKLRLPDPNDPKEGVAEVMPSTPPATVKKKPITPFGKQSKQPVASDEDEKSLQDKINYYAQKGHDAYDDIESEKYHKLSLQARAKLKALRKQGVAEGYILKKTKVEKTFTPGDPDEYYTSGGADVTRKDTDYEIINNKTGQVVGTASWTTNDYFGPGALKITMKNGATRWLDIYPSEKGNPQTAFNRFVKDPKTSKKYKDQGVAEGLDPDTQRLEQDVRDALENGDDYTAKQYAKMASTPEAKKYLLNIIKQAMYSDEEGMAETKVDRYKELGATKNTTHFVKNMTTGKIVSPHRSEQDAKDALVANRRDSKDEFKIVRARKESVEEDVTQRSAANRLTRKFENYLTNKFEMLESGYGSEKKKFKVEAAPTYPNAQDPNAQTTSPQPPTAQATKDEQDKKREQQVDIATAKGTMSGLKNVLGPSLDINQAASAVTKINDRKPLTGPEQQAMSAITPLLAKAAEMPQTASNLKTSLTNAAYLAKLGK